MRRTRSEATSGGTNTGGASTTIATSSQRERRTPRAVLRAPHQEHDLGAERQPDKDVHDLGREEDRRIRRGHLDQNDRRHEERQSEQHKLSASIEGRDPRVGRPHQRITVPDRPFQSVGIPSAGQKERSAIIRIP